MMSRLEETVMKSLVLTDILVETTILRNHGRLDEREWKGCRRLPQPASVSLLITSRMMTGAKTQLY
jgi:hypothetical protein